MSRRFAFLTEEAMRRVLTALSRDDGRSRCFPSLSNKFHHQPCYEVRFRFSGCSRVAQAGITSGQVS